MNDVSYTLELSFKEFNINLDAFLSDIKQNYSNCCGSSADNSFKLHFTAKPTEEEIEMIKESWASITEESEMATSYQSREAELAAPKASAKAKLKALGLTDEEISAFLG